MGASANTLESFENTKANRITKPTLRVYTVYFHESDHDHAYTLGSDLYALLTRPPDNPLAFGAGVPVLIAAHADNVDISIAEHVVIIPVLGKESYAIARNDITDRVQQWSQTLGTGHVIPVPTSENWRNASIPSVQLLTELYTEANEKRHTLEEIVLAIAKLLGHNQQKPQLFISHAKADLAKTNHAAKRIHKYVVNNTTGSAFYDQLSLSPGHSLKSQLQKTIGPNTIFIAVNSDSYNSRPWCQEEFLLAKQNCIPTISVVVLEQGEPRSSSFGGNIPSIVWRDNPEEIALRAMVEWLKAHLFQREALRIYQEAQLPEPCIMHRPPELLDLTGNQNTVKRSRLVMHPDPELPITEKNILASATESPYLVTPTTAYRFFRGQSDKQHISTTASPLDGQKIGISLSDSPDVDGPEGYTKNHVDDAISYVCRCLVSAGAAIAYGGDFRSNGYTELLSQLIASYNQTASNDSALLQSYLASVISIAEMPDNLQITAHHMSESPKLSARAILPPPTQDNYIPSALYFSDMRRVMSQDIAASIFVGGAAEPQIKERGNGYTGRYPGIVEEAWHMLQVGKPIYVVGGFGGAAKLIADLMRGNATPKRLLDETWLNYHIYAEKAKFIDDSKWHTKLNLPDSIADMAAAIRQKTDSLLQSDKASLAWNGLTVAENHTLFNTRDPVQIAARIFKGLLVKTAQQSQDKLSIELVRGDILSDTTLDAISIPVCNDIPAGGVAGVVNKALDNRLSVAIHNTLPVIGVSGKALHANWVHLANLTRSDNETEIPFDIQSGVESAVHCARRYGFHKLGVVLYGATLVGQPVAGSSKAIDRLIDQMIEGFQGKLPKSTALVWYEADHQRFAHIKQRLAELENIHLTTLILQDLDEPPVTTQSLVIHAELSDDETSLQTTIIPPAGTAVASYRKKLLQPGLIKQLSQGIDQHGNSTPGMAELAARGQTISSIMLGKDADEFLQKIGQSGIHIVHNLAASKIPFESMTTKSIKGPAFQSGMSRRLLIEKGNMQQLFADPPVSGAFRVLLVADPLNDLPGARKEAEELEKVLEPLPHIELMSLWNKHATIEAVMTALPDIDVIHYCGHASYSGPGPNDSGIWLAGKQLLTAGMLSNLTRLPRIAIFNACQAGRLRGRDFEDEPIEVINEAAVFAEYFLRSGVEAYIGTHWYVGDNAAKEFTGELYKQLAASETLGESVRCARQLLYENNRRDWANYVLYGEGGFRLLQP